MSTASVAVWGEFRARAVAVKRARSLPVWFLVVTLTIAAAGVVSWTTRPPVSMAVQEQSGQLIIRWTPGGSGRLEIRDGDFRAQVDIAPRLSALTYSRRTNDVSLTLIARGRRNSARFLSRAADAEQLAEDLSTLEIQARAARIQTESSLWRIAEMQRTANRLLAQIKPRDAETRAIANPPPRRRAAMTWWR